MRDRTKQRMRGLVYDALHVIEADPSRPLALDEVARDIATSRRSLQRAFESEGITFREAVAVARMRRAKALLAQGGMPIYAVAHRAVLHAELLWRRVDHRVPAPLLVVVLQMRVDRAVVLRRLEHHVRRDVR